MSTVVQDAPPRRSWVKPVLFRTLALALSLSLLFFAAEIALRILGIGYGSTPLESDARVHHVHPRDYRFTSYDPQGEFGGHAVYFDRDGCVADPEGRVRGASDAKTRVAVLGDSFSEGLQVPYVQSYAGRLQATAGRDVCVKNFAVASYSPVLDLMKWRYEVADFHPTHVVLQLYSNDISDDERYRESAEYGPDGEIVGVRGPGGGWLTKQLRKSFVARLLRSVQMRWRYARKQTDERQQIIEALVEEDPELSDFSTQAVLTLANEVRAAGATFVLTVVPSKFRLIHGADDDSSPQFSDKWRAWAAEHDIRFLDLVAPFEDASRGGRTLFFPHDIHFNAEGHAVASEAIRQSLPDVFGDGPNTSGELE